MARILVVDDEPDVCDGIRDLLEMDGHEVVIKSGTKGAMDFLKKEGQKLDVAIIDMFMEEEKSGLKLIKFITRRHLPVASIVLTGHGNEQNVLQSMNAGAYHYITKGSKDQPERIRLAVRGAFLAIEEKRRVAAVFGRLKRRVTEFSKRLREFESELRRIDESLPDLEELADERADSR